MKKEFALQNKPFSYIISVNYRNWKQTLKNEGKKTMTVKTLLESSYVKNHWIKRQYNNFCITYGHSAVDDVLLELFNTSPNKSKKRKAV